MTQAEYLDRKTEALPPKRSMADLTATLTESQRDGLLALAQSLGGDGWDLELYFVLHSPNGYRRSLTMTKTLKIRLGAVTATLRDDGSVRFSDGLEIFHMELTQEGWHRLVQERQKFLQDNFKPDYELKDEAAARVKAKAQQILDDLRRQTG